MMVLNLPGRARAPLAAAARQPVAFRPVRALAPRRRHRPANGDTVTSELHDASRSATACTDGTQLAALIDRIRHNHGIAARAGIGMPANMQTVARTHREQKDGETAGHICFDGNNQRFTLSPTVAKKEQPQEDYNLRFRDQDIVSPPAPTDKARDEFRIPTANPANYFHVISNSADLPKLAIDGKLFLPASDNRKRNGKLPLVMVVPGSLGVAPRTSNMPKRWYPTALRPLCSIALARAT